MSVYDNLFDPPAPCASISVQHPARPGIVQSLKAQIDTGADISLIPTNVVNKLGLSIVSRLLTEAYDGTQMVLNVCEAALVVENENLGIVEMCVLDQDCAILGRDALNLFVTILDGPALTFEMRLSRTPSP